MSKWTFKKFEYFKVGIGPAWGGSDWSHLTKSRFRVPLKDGTLEMAICHLSVAVNCPKKQGHKNGTWLILGCHLWVGPYTVGWVCGR